MKHILLFASALTMAAGSSASEQKSADTPALTVSAYSFEAHGQSVPAEKGEFWVPENRANPASRRIKLSFVRFPSTNPNKGAPIVYLAGGPGGSGVATARRARFPIFMALREVADVIAFDQRGTGWSNDIPACRTQHQYPFDKPMRRDLIASLLHEVAKECARFWKDAGIDISGYNTNESAADLEALRRALGAQKVKLWGISYGSHLALAAIKRYPDKIERAVLASIEGLDEAVKLPARTDAFFARVQAVIDANPDASKAYPDLAGLMRRVLAKLDEHPVTVAVQDAQGRDVKLVIGKYDIQLLTAWSISDPALIARVPAMYAQMESGEFDEVAAVLFEHLRGPGGTEFRGMPELMDVASGISAERASLVRRQAKTSLLADALNFPMPHLAGAFGGIDLGDEFRRSVSSDIPVLFISGTLDGRTYPESAAQIATRFENATHVIVENGGHNIFEADPRIQEMVVAFMKDERLPSTALKLPAPQFLQ